MKNKAVIGTLCLVFSVAFLSGCNITNNFNLGPGTNVEKSEDSADKSKEDENSDTKAASTDNSEEVKEENKEEKKEDKAPEFKIGAYSYEYEEEYADGMEKFTNYLYFDKDGKGFGIFQDDIPFTYSDGQIKSEDGSVFTYKLLSDTSLEIDNSGIVNEYTYCGESLPEDVLDHMNYYLDGTRKVNNMEAGFAFNDLITSDVINFYGSSSSKEYTAEGNDLSSMGAVYLELTDNFISVLLVKTPNAPDEVGKEHVLQFVDGKIYNIFGCDKIEEIYKNSAVIMASRKEGGEETQYYYTPDENNELYNFALHSSGLSSDRYILYDSYGDGNEVTQDEFKTYVDEKIASDEAIKEVEWKVLDKTFPW